MMRRMVSEEEVDQQRAPKDSDAQLRFEHKHNAKRLVTLGVCAMHKKTKSVPMRQILDRLSAYGEFEIVVFPEEMILREPIESWPVVDCLISFCSGKFPLDKAAAYVNLRHPFCINEVAPQTALKNREQTYKLLEKFNIPTPRHLYAHRPDKPISPLPPDVDVKNISPCPNIISPEDGSVGGSKLLGAVLSKGKQSVSVKHLERLVSMTMEPPGCDGDEIVQLYDDYIMVNGERLDFPLVEKPYDGDNHNIHILYGKGKGGRKLFRKITDRSSEFYPDLHSVRINTSYIYEPFLQKAKDLKIYTVGPDYAHGEARKSPAVDGIVQRDPDDKELRLLTKLTPAELEISRRICYIFKQNVCGFDIIRHKGRSYVIDVNGWSFVKGDLRYYDNCARILRKMCLGCARGRSVMALRRSLPAPRDEEEQASQPKRDNSSNREESTKTKAKLASAYSLHGKLYQRCTEGEEKDGAISDLKLSSERERSENQPFLPLSPSSYGDLRSVCESGSAFHSGFNNDVLRSMVVMFRHADRGPKHKIKVKSNNALLMNFFKTHPQQLKYQAERAAEEKLKAERNSEDDEDDESSDEYEKDGKKQGEFTEVKLLEKKDMAAVLELVVRIIEESKERFDRSSKKLSEAKPDVDAPALKKLQATKKKNADLIFKLQQVRNILEETDVGASKIQLKPVFETQEQCSEDGEKKTVELMIGVLVICKWGGQLTHAGKQQTGDYVPVFWDEMLRPCPPPPPDVTDDWDEDSVNVNTNLQTLTEEILSADPTIMHQSSSFTDLDDVVTHDENDYSKEDKALRALYEDESYRAARFDFLRGMRVFASGEDRVRATAQEFITASLKTMELGAQEDATQFKVPLQSDGEVMKFLDDIAPEAKKALKTAKADVSRLVCSKINYFKTKKEPMTASPSRPQTPSMPEDNISGLNRSASLRRSLLSRTAATSPDGEKYAAHFGNLPSSSVDSLHGLSDLQLDTHGKSSHGHVSCDSSSPLASPDGRDGRPALSRSPSPALGKSESLTSATPSVQPEEDTNETEAETQEKAVEKDVVAVMMRRRRKEIEKEQLRRVEKKEKEKAKAEVKAKKAQSKVDELLLHQPSPSSQPSGNSTPAADVPGKEEVEADDEEELEDINTDEEDNQNENEEDDYVKEEDIENLERLEKNITMNFQDKMMPVARVTARVPSMDGDEKQPLENAESNAVDGKVEPNVPTNAKQTLKKPDAKGSVTPVLKPSKKSKFVAAANPADLNTYHRDVVSRHQKRPSTSRGGVGSDSLDLDETGILDSNSNNSNNNSNNNSSNNNGSNVNSSSNSGRNSLIVNDAVDPSSSSSSLSEKTMSRDASGKHGRKGWWLVQEERKFHISMTKWGLRCLRWLNKPRDTLKVTHGLLKFIVLKQIYQKLDIPWEDDDMAEFSVYDDYINDGDNTVPAWLGLEQEVNNSNQHNEETEIEGCGRETLWNMKERWDRVMKEYYDPRTRMFNVTKVPDLYDNIKYDVIHNRHVLRDLRAAYRAVKRMADFVIPQEYGVLRQDKFVIGKTICQPLLDRIVVDLERGLQEYPSSRVNCYFSSESHLHSLRNILLLSGATTNKTVATALESIELNYLSHCVFRLFEDLSRDLKDPLRFYVNIQFSPGAALDPFIFAEVGHKIPVSRPTPVHGRVPWKKFRELFLSHDVHVARPGRLNANER